MPTYVYKFIDTGETIEVQQAFTDDALTEAVYPQTGQTMPVKKVFLPVGVAFKGGGFYKTDSRNGSSSSSSTTPGTSTDAGPSGTGSSGTGSSGSGSSDSGSSGSGSSGSGSSGSENGSSSSGSNTPSTPAPVAASTSNSSSAD